MERSREYAADAIIGNPDALASALEKLVNPLKGGGVNVAGLFSTHPPIEERIRRLHTMQLRAVA